MQSTTTKRPRGVFRRMAMHLAAVRPVESLPRHHQTGPSEYRLMLRRALEWPLYDRLKGSDKGSTFRPCGAAYPGCSQPRDDRRRGVCVEVEGDRHGRVAGHL